MNSCNHLLSPPNHQAPRKLSVKCLKGTSQRGMGYKDKEREKKKSADTCTHRHTSWKYDVTVCWSLDVIPIRTLSLVKHYISMFLEQTSLCKCGCWCVDVCVSALNLQNIGQWPVQCPCPRKKLISASFYVSPFNQCFCPFAPAQKSTCRFLSMYCVSMCVCLDVLARADKERLAECCFLSAHQRQHCFNLIAIIHWKHLPHEKQTDAGKRSREKYRRCLTAFSFISQVFCWMCVFTLRWQQSVCMLAYVWAYCLILFYFFLLWFEKSLCE